MTSALGIPRTRSELLDLQSKRLSVALAQAWEIPFFRQKFQTAGFDESAATDPGQLRLLPLTAKAELRSSEATHPPFGNHRGAPISAAVRMTTSSGASGRPTINMMTRRDLQAEYFLQARGFARSGLKAGDTQINAHPAYLYGASELISATHEAYGMLAVCLGPPGSDDEVTRQLELIADLKPHSATLFPPPVLRYVKVAAERLGKRFPQDFGLEQMSLKEFGLQFEDARQWFEELLGVRIFSSFGGSETYGAMGSACDRRIGNHVNEDYVVLEVLDPETLEPLPDGEIGTMVATTLEKDNILIRYLVGDSGFFDSEPCPCGDPSRLFYRLGRAEDMLRVADQVVTTSDILRSLAGVEEIGLGALEFQAVIPLANQSHLELVVPAGDSGATGLSKAISDHASHYLGLECRVYASSTSEFTYKPRRLIESLPS